MPHKPTLLYDGDCGLCWRAVQWIQKITAGAVEYAPYQTALARFPQVTERQCAASVQLIMPAGAVYSAAHAAFKALALSGRHGFALWLYEYIAPFKLLSEFCYRLVARHRGFIAKFFKIPACRIR